MHIEKPHYIHWVAERLHDHRFVWTTDDQGASCLYCVDCHNTYYACEECQMSGGVEPDEEYRRQYPQAIAMDCPYCAGEGIIPDEENTELPDPFEGEELTLPRMFTDEELDGIF